MALEVEIELRWMRNIAIDDRPRWAVAAPVGVLLREEPDVVTLADHDEGDLRLDSQRPTGL